MWYTWLLNPLKAISELVNGDSEERHPELGVANDIPFVDVLANAGADIVDGAESVGEGIDNAVDYFTEGEGADAVNKLWNNLTGERDTIENEKNRQFQAEEAEKARQWEEEQAKAAREWDSIGPQMERAAAAGVNPISVAMQSGGIGQSATTSIPSAPGYPSGSSGLMHGGIMDIASTIFNGIGTFAEQRLKMSQSDDIVAMRKYNIAEKQANIAHLKSLNESVGLSNIAQTIQNKWLDSMQNLQYMNMLRDLGVKDSLIREHYSVSQLNLSQVQSVREHLKMDIQRFNQTLPIELQLMEAELDLTKKNAQDVYEEICLRHLQCIEQENRNRQSSAEADTSEVTRDIARQTYEDAINQFHNDMVRGAAEAGVAMNDYLYYGVNTSSFAQVPGRVAMNLGNLFRRGNKRSWSQIDSELRGISPISGY